MTGAPDSATERRVLLALRLAGVAETAEVTRRLSIGPGDTAATTDTEAILRALAERGLVRERTGALAGWQLTPDGIRAGEALLGAELAEANGGPVIEAAYGTFLDLNRRMLSVLTAWQVRSDGDDQVPNDHLDAAYDRSVLADLRLLDDDLRGLIDGLGATLPRYSGYADRLDGAWQRVSAGDLSWVDRPRIDSIHTLWFELHEDLLATLGLDRAAETARDAGSRSDPSD